MITLKENFTIYLYIAVPYVMVVYCMCSLMVPRRAMSNKGMMCTCVYKIVYPMLDFNKDFYKIFIAHNLNYTVYELQFMFCFLPNSLLTFDVFADLCI